MPQCADMPHSPLPTCKTSPSCAFHAACNKPVLISSTATVPEENPTAAQWPSGLTVADFIIPTKHNLKKKLLLI